MSDRMDGKVVLLTGAARGIGEASARAFAARGASVVIADVLDEARQVVDDIVAGGGAASFVETDVTDSDAVARAVRHAVDEFGRLDMAHNNAGIFRAAPIAELADDDWRAVIDVDLSGIFYAVKHELRHMLSVGAGSIVNTASVWSYAGSAGQGAYVAAKHGVVGLTKSAALDHGGNGIRINAVAPGPIETPMTAGVPSEVMAGTIARTIEGRFGQPHEIANAVVWLCSDDASYVNGAVLAVDGGWLA